MLDLSKIESGKMTLYLEDFDVAKLVKEVAERHRPAKKGKKVARPVRLRVPGGTVVIEPNKAFTSVEDALVAALAQVRQAASKAA